MNIPVIRWGATVERKDAGEFVSYHDYSMLHAQIETLRDDMQRRIKLGKDAADEIDRLRAKLESRTQALHAAEQRELTALAELDEVRAELTEARRLIDEARRQEPVIHQYQSVNGKWYSAPERQVKIARDAYGAPIRTLYVAPVPAQPAVPDDVAKDATIDVDSLACALAVVDGYDPKDPEDDLWDVHWSSGAQPEPEGDLYSIEYVRKANRILAILSAADDEVKK